MSTPSSVNIAVIGSGPAALMAADRLSSQSQGHGKIAVHIFEKRKSAGRKLLIAGSSGLNITHTQAVTEVLAAKSPVLTAAFQSFDSSQWIRFIENELGIKTFEGTSRRFFVEDMKAAQLLSAWTKRLITRGVTFHFGHECTAFDPKNRTVTFQTSEGLSAAGHSAPPLTLAFDAVIFALGGGSWEPNEKPLRWPTLFLQNQIQFEPFRSSNVGFDVAWPEAFLKEAEGLPLKNIVMTGTAPGPYGVNARAGDAMITAYGIEGTPVYFVGRTGPVHVDLRPDLSAEQIAQRLASVRENLAPIRRIKKSLQLCPAAFALVFHLAPRSLLTAPPGATLEASAFRKLATWIKNVPLELGAPRPLDEAISSAGGIALSEIDESLELRRAPGFYVAGEMLDWDVPTGGFWIQGSVAMGAWAAQSVLRGLKFNATPKNQT